MPQKYSGILCFLMHSRVSIAIAPSFVHRPRTAETPILGNHLANVDSFSYAAFVRVQIYSSCFTLTEIIREEYSHKNILFLLRFYYFISHCISRLLNCGGYYGAHEARIPLF